MIYQFTWVGWTFWPALNCKLVVWAPPQQQSDECLVSKKNCLLLQSFRWKFIACQPFPPPSPCPPRQKRPPWGRQLLYGVLWLNSVKPEGGGVAKVCRAFGLQQPLVWAGGGIRLKWKNNKTKTEAKNMTKSRLLGRKSNMVQWRQYELGWIHCWIDLKCVRNLI